MGDLQDKETSDRISEAEAEPEQTKTFDSDDDDDYDDDDDEIEEYDEISFLRQHFVAIFVAVVASIAVHVNHQISRTDMERSTSSTFPRFDFSSWFAGVEKHTYLEDFSRTANISFCHQEIQPAASKQLQGMDFYLPQEYFEPLKVLFVADQTEDNFYEETHGMLSSSSTMKGIGAALKENAEFQCLLKQHRDHPLDRKFKGTTFFYKDPTLEEIYPELAAREIGSSHIVTRPSRGRKKKLQQPPLSFTGFATKVVNLHTDAVLLYWDGKGGHEESRKLVGEIPPMESIGTATMPGHSFHVTPIYDSSTILKHWVVTPDSALVFYEAKSAEEVKKELQVENPALYAMYQRQLINKSFSRDYMVATGRTWLAQFPRPFPIHYMHDASFIGQELLVSDMTLKVLSVRPRVFQIDNFLTAEQCKEVIRMGLDQGLTESTLHASPLAKQRRDLSTRSSHNAWLSRETSPLTEIIYEKAAELTKIDARHFQNIHQSSAQHHSIAESLQVVRYKKGEEYTPHHDFISPSINNRHQPSRFATLLIYLNDVKEGGETRFPRALNNYNSEGLEITPKVGRAVLFYSTLEDGNFDDLSQHGGNKVLAGNKWLANLWIWDPVIG
mmetsp:Transcript_10538/g.25391  ORF Transcript_10538/g.25391 Transcript_10538/m.25391 type:complete len:613 (-) Transcript_10538:2-1840(-)